MEVITEIKRKGKLLQFCLQDAKFLFSHLGMSGGWRISKIPIAEKHTHLHLKIENQFGEKYLAYVDPRRFGQLDYLRNESAQKKLSLIGPDLTSPLFNASYLQRIFKANAKKILKSFMLDQKFFAGLGNYMASEICARAGIRPMRKCNKINRQDCQKIFAATQSVINGSLKHQGLTFSGGYSDTTGAKGKGLTNLVVFHQKICGLCKSTPVKKNYHTYSRNFLLPSLPKIMADSFILNIRI